MIQSNTNQLSHSLLLIIFAVLLTGCQTTTEIQIDPYLTFHDDLFPDYHKIAIETATEVFSIDDVAKTFVNEKLHRIEDPVKQIQKLAEGIFNHADLNLLYKNDANTVANETFNNQAANCLSLTIMTYALADYAGFGVRFQQVKTPDLWVRREGTSLLNRHINLRLYPKTNSNILLYENESFQLDFDRRAQSFHLPSKTVDKQTVLALFYNNKGADALIKGKYTKAYAYFRSALITDPLLVEATINIGILYRWSNQQEYAEYAYLQALAIDNTDTAAWENLAFIYAISDRKEKADSINRRILKLRKTNPFYHFMLGEKAYEKKAWQQAIKHFKDAVKLDSRQHQFYFALAKSYSQLGDIEYGQQYIELAKKHTHNDRDALFYQSKLDHLN